MLFRTFRWSSLVLLVMLCFSLTQCHDNKTPPPDPLNQLEDSTHMYWYTDSTHGAGGVIPAQGALGINILGDASSITLNRISGVEHVYVYDLGVYNPAVAPGPATLIGTLSAPGDNIPLTVGNWYYAAPNRELYYPFTAPSGPGTEWTLCSENIFPPPGGSRSITVVVNP